MVAKTPVLDCVISDDALRFAQEHRIIEYVEKAMQSAREIYTDGEPISVDLKKDPEFGDFYVEIQVLLRESESPESAAEKDDACYGKWASFMPPEIASIRLKTDWAR